VEGAALRGGLLVRCLRRLGQEKLFSFDIDEDVAAAVAAFELGTMPLVDFAADPGNFSRVETHHVTTLARSAPLMERRIGCI